MEETKRFHITIKDLKENTIEVDCDTDAIIGAYGLDNYAGGLLFTSCNLNDLVAVTLGAELIVKKARETPMFDIAEKLIGVRIVED